MATSFGIIFFYFLQWYYRLDFLNNNTGMSIKLLFDIIGNLSQDGWQTLLGVHLNMKPLFLSFWLLLEEVILSLLIIIANILQSLTKHMFSIPMSNLIHWLQKVRQLLLFLWSMLHDPNVFLHGCYFLFQNC